MRAPYLAVVKFMIRAVIDYRYRFGTFAKTMREVPISPDLSRILT